MSVSWWGEVELKLAVVIIPPSSVNRNAKRQSQGLLRKEHVSLWLMRNDDEVVKIS